jgi:hypothetical protein
VAGIVAVRLGLLGSVANPDSPSLGFVLLIGGFYRTMLVLSGMWIGGGLVLLLRRGPKRVATAG